MQQIIEFSKNAKTYARYNIIQEQVVAHLLDNIIKKRSSIIDLGCGHGGVYRAIDWKLKAFYAVDFSAQMLELHPKAKEVETILGDFNQPELFKDLKSLNADYLISASALQWASDLNALLGQIKQMHIPFALAIFTSGTFKTLNETAGLPPLLRSKDEVIESVIAHFEATVELKKYTLAFKTTREMFSYIKRSGVSGGRNALNYKQMKRLMREYPLNYLEFEVLFIHSENLH